MERAWVSLEERVWFFYGFLTGFAFFLFVIAVVNL